MKHLKLLSICAVLFVASLLTACHTVNGAGQDIQAGGRAVSRAAS
jgi:predicted small secreted protein